MPRTLGFHCQRARVTRLATRTGVPIRGTAFRARGVHRFPWFLALLILLVGLFFRFGPSHASAMAPVTGSPRSDFNPFLCAADVVLPVIDFGEANRWQADLV